MNSAFRDIFERTHVIVKDPRFIAGISDMISECRPDFVKKAEGQVSKFFDHYRSDVLASLTGASVLGGLYGLSATRRPFEPEEEFKKRRIRGILATGAVGGGIGFARPTVDYFTGGGYFHGGGLAGKVDRMTEKAEQRRVAAAEAERQRLRDSGVREKPRGLLGAVRETENVIPAVGAVTGGILGTRMGLNDIAKATEEAKKYQTSLQTVTSNMADRTAKALTNGDPNIYRSINVLNQGEINKLGPYVNNPTFFRGAVRDATQFSGVTAGHDVITSGVEHIGGQRYMGPMEYINSQGTTLRGRFGSIMPGAKSMPLVKGVGGAGLGWLAGKVVDNFVDRAADRYANGEPIWPWMEVKKP